MWYTARMEGKKQVELKDIKGPEDIRGLDAGQLAGLAEQMRRRVVEVVSENGGHLASNLGAVELTLALHRVFESPGDKLVFDVGHQCYAHKMLTGRADALAGLRRYGGVSGFPRMDESVHDAYGTGHASTAISAALGLARARDLAGGTGHVVAVVGDGAMTGGLCYEALNDAGNRKTRLIVVLNDNQMSIAPNVGALSNYLTFLRSSKAWLGIKKKVTGVLPRVPLVGEPLFRFFHRVKDAVRNFFVRDRFFDALGFRYLGPVDGHNLASLEAVLQRAKRFQEPVLVHAVTRKGRGYGYAENAPASTHGVNPFDPESGAPRSAPSARSFGEAAGELLLELAKQDARVVAVTAAMAEATGLSPFQRAFPERLFDVGIAEAHAVTLAAGLAAAGMRPVVAIYETFLQRAYDQVVVDVCQQGLPVVFLLDRAAMGGADGPTHHGVFGSAFLRHIPGLTLLSPRSVGEMEHMLRFAMGHPGPVAIRYPRAESGGMAELPCPSFAPGVWERLSGREGLCLIALGPMVTEALAVRRALAAAGVKAQVINASSVKPLDGALLKELSAANRPFVVLEEQPLAGGLGSAIGEYCAQNGLRPPERVFCLPDAFVPHGSHAELLRHCGLDADSVSRQLLDIRVNIA